MYLETPKKKKNTSLHIENYDKILKSLKKVVPKWANNQAQMSKVRKLLQFERVWFIAASKTQTLTEKSSTSTKLDSKSSSFSFLKKIIK